MRIFAGCLLLVAAALTPQQTSSDFHALYGKSDQDRFLVRPGLYLTVQYGDDETASQMKIWPVPQPPDKTTGVPPEVAVSEAELATLIAELEPPSLRGAEIGSSRGDVFEDEEYENVVISQEKFRCPNTPSTCIQSEELLYKKRAARGGTAKSSTEYRVRYGKSDMERFMVRRGIDLTVEYSGDGTACQLGIATAEPLIEDSGHRSLVMTESDVLDIENELVPSNLRGEKLPRSGSAQMGAVYAESEEYEHVSIGRWMVLGKQSEKRILDSTIQFKKKECFSLIQRTGSPPGVFSSAKTVR